MSKLKIADRLPKPVKLAAISAFICGLVTHLYAIVNNLHCADDIAQQPRGYGTGITSGRWFLSLLGDFMESIGGNYNLPLVNGILFILVLAFAAGFLVHTLDIQKKASALWLGMLFVVFPTVTVTMLFRYTTVYNGLAVLFAVLAAWVLERSRYGLPLSALFTALSLGIYQAYVPITIGVFVLLLIRKAMQEGTKVRDLVRKGLFHCAALVLGLLLYYLLLKLSLVLYGTALSEYQGMNNMGKLSLSALPELIKEAIAGVLFLPVRNYCGLSGMRTVKIAYLLMGGVSAVLLCYLLLTRVRRWGMAAMTGILCLAFVVSVNFIVIMCPDAWIYTMMVYGFVMIPFFPMVLLECLPEEPGRYAGLAGKLCVGALVLLTLSYAYEANISYTTVYFANRQMENYCTSLVTQVRMTKGFTPEKNWAFIGKIDDPLLNCPWRYEIRYYAEFTDGLLNRPSMHEWIQNYTGYLPPKLSEEECAALAKTPEVKSMPCWPSEGSVKVIGDTVVLKFEELP